MTKYLVLRPGENNNYLYKTDAPPRQNAYVVPAELDDRTEDELEVVNGQVQLKQV